MNLSDGDTLLNYQEYLGQDGYRIDYITGTGDETDPWISRVLNNSSATAFGNRTGQIGAGGSFCQAPSSYLNVYR